MNHLRNNEEHRLLHQLFERAMRRNEEKYRDDLDGQRVSQSILNALSHTFYKLMNGEEPSVEPAECYFWQTWNHTKRPFVSVEDLVEEVPRPTLIEAIENHPYPFKYDFRAIFGI